LNDISPVIRESDLSNISKSSTPFLNTDIQNTSEIVLTNEQIQKQRKPRTGKGVPRSTYITRQQTGSISLKEYFKNKTPKPKLIIEKVNED
jgi:hypothetical protein